MSRRRVGGKLQIAEKQGTCLWNLAALLLLACATAGLNACSGFSVPASVPSSSNSSPAKLLVGSSLPSGTVGAAYSATITVSGGTTPYKLSVAAGQLPAGVQLAYSSGAVTGMPMASGNFSFTVSVADAAGLSQQQPLQIVVAPAASTGGGGTGGGGGSGGGSGSQANSFSNLQQSGGWADYGQGPPSFVDCSPSPCDGITFSITQNVSSPSMSGAAAQFSLGGSVPYNDALFNNHLIGAFSSQGLPDTSQTLVPTLHNFTYDVYFYGTNLELSQAIEFDTNQFFDNLGFIWGHECRIAGGHEWDVWDNVNAHWVPTGIACNPVDNSWNHLTIQVERTSSNQLLYQSITLNGVTSQVNQTYNPGSAVGWYGVTINYQMDGNYAQSAYAVYLDELTFTYR
jgi:putative Ig domain-containing protein